MTEVFRNGARYHLTSERTSRLDQAMSDYERALALDANYAPAWLGRGLVHKARGEAVQALEASYNRGLLYQSEKQHQFAIEDFTVANGLVPQQLEPLLGRPAPIQATCRIGGRITIVAALATPS